MTSRFFDSSIGVISGLAIFVGLRYIIPGYTALSALILLLTARLYFISDQTAEHTLQKLITQKKVLLLRVLLGFALALTSFYILLESTTSLLELYQVTAPASSRLLPIADACVGILCSLSTAFVSIFLSVDAHWHLSEIPADNFFSLKKSNPESINHLPLR